MTSTITVNSITVNSITISDPFATLQIVNPSGSETISAGLTNSGTVLLPSILARADEVIE